MCKKSNTRQSVLNTYPFSLNYSSLPKNASFICKKEKTESWSFSTYKDFILQILIIFSKSKYFLRMLIFVVVDLSIAPKDTIKTIK